MSSGERQITGSNEDIFAHVLGAFLTDAVTAVHVAIVCQMQCQIHKVIINDLSGHISGLILLTGIGEFNTAVESYRIGALIGINRLGLIGVFCYVTGMIYCGLACENYFVTIRLGIER